MENYRHNNEQGNASLLERVEAPENINKWMSSIVYKECKRCLLSEAPEGGSVEIDEDGICEYCQIHDRLESQSKLSDLFPALDKISRRGLRKQYDCIIGISGGLDSSTLLYAAVKKWNLRPLVIHFDNGWNNDQAESNMKNLVEHLNVNLITYKLDKHEYDTLNMAFLEFGLPDADIPNDIAMTKLMYDTADKYGIKWILNGHDFREEGSTPAAWTYMDAKYISDVYTQYTKGFTLENYPLFTFWDQIKYAFRGIKQIRPFHFGFDRKPIEDEMKQAIGWQDYGGKHCENIYTEFVGSHLLPLKFNIDKRIVYLSARVRSGTLTRQEAKLIFSGKSLFDLNKLGKDKDRILAATHGPKHDRSEFKRYNFRKWSAVIWLLALLKVVPQTFYIKYCKK
jgi:hypothetical protein